MASSSAGEWLTLRRLLPPGWQRAAAIFKAFRRSRALRSSSALLRLLLFHAANNGGLRSTVEQAQQIGLARISDVALRKRLRNALGWLQWMGAQLCQQVREGEKAPKQLRLRAIDSTTVQGPRSEGTEWRLHYTLNLHTLQCDWHRLADAHVSEALEWAPVCAGDVLVADRNFLRPRGVHAVRQADGHVVVRLKWTHPKLVDAQGRRVRALTKARSKRVAQPGDWPVLLWDAAHPDKPLPGRVITLKLPAPLAERARQQAERSSRKKGKRPDPRSLEAAQYVMLFTTLAPSWSAARVLEIYRWRWQVEVAFKRLKQLLRLGHLPHDDPGAAQAWVQAKMLLALLLEKIERLGRSFSPWGYPLLGLRRLDVSALALALVALRIEGGSGRPLSPMYPEKAHATAIPGEK